jgi:2-haloacid dehalogenase
MAIRAITFDVYSALFDIVTGLTDALTDLFWRRRVEESPAAAARLWRQMHLEYLLLANSLDREPALNRRAIEAAAGYVLRRIRPAVPPEEMQTLVAAWEQLPPWPEAIAVLTRVRRQPLILGVLSNGDERMLDALLGRLSVRFDRIISTEGGRFKPHLTVYQKAAEQCGVRPDELLHVAGSATDAMGATAAGIKTVWVNRADDAVMDPRLAPAHEIPDLWGLLQILAGA